MSRHQAYRNYDYENDLEEDYGEEEAELSPEDKAQMEAATIEVRGALGPQASKVTTTQIQDALWHYYYDVNKTATYLVDHYIAPPAPKAAKAAPAQKAKPSGKLGAVFFAHPSPCIPSSGEVVAPAAPNPGPHVRLAADVRSTTGNSRAHPASLAD